MKIIDPNNPNAKSKLYLDSETCGLHSMMVLLQYAKDDGPIVLYDVWKKPVGETIDLIEWICEHTVVGFNLVFDWFHIVKIYTIFSLCPRDWIPEEHIEEIAMLEPKGQDGPCVKPVNALDLLLHSRKGPYQSLMAREDIRIRRVPTVLAYALAELLEERVQLDGIYFARSADKDAPRWSVFDVKNRDGELDPNFKDVCLRFNPAGGLKYLAEHALGYEPKFHYKDVEPDKAWYPKELGYAPTALAVSSPEQNWEVWETKDGKERLAGHAWPAVIKHFIEHWATNKNAREYATDDIVYTRGVDLHFGCPTPGDDDSILACMVPVIRWRGFTINVEGMKTLREKAQAVIANSPVNINKPKDVRAYILACMDDTENLVAEIKGSTNKKNLEKLAKIMVTEEQLYGDDDDEDELDGVNLSPIREPEHCTKCDGKGHHAGGHCHRCDGRGFLKVGEHPAATRAKEILKVKTAAKEVELYTKLIRAGKFHASFNVVGTLSSRMSGGDGLNAQGIKASDEVRSNFPLAWEGYDLCGGDFDSFEVTLADAVYGCEKLHSALISRVACHECKASGLNKPLCKPCGALKKEKKDYPQDCLDCLNTKLQVCKECEGSKKTTKKIHGLFGQELFNATYEEIIASKDWYGKAKSGVFAMTYGGNAKTLEKNLSVSKEIAERAFENWGRSYPGIGKARKRIENAFASIKQPGGIGTMIIWTEPKEYVESFLGFRRYFTLENRICRELFDLARKPPKTWRDTAIKVVRSQRVQTAGGAVASALYGAAFGIQANMVRAAANHEIQSPGGQITKRVQRRVWDLQPAGISPILVAPMNIHDELMTVTHPSVVKEVTKIVWETVEFYRPQVPLIGMTWFEQMANWAEKKAGAEAVKMRAAELLVGPTPDVLEALAA